MFKPIPGHRKHGVGEGQECQVERCEMYLMGASRRAGSTELRGAHSWGDMGGSAGEELAGPGPVGPLHGPALSRVCPEEAAMTGGAESEAPSVAVDTCPLAAGAPAPEPSLTGIMMLLLTWNVYGTTSKGHLQ